MTAMNSIAESTTLALPRLDDGFINIQEVLRQLAESVASEIMSAEADQLCGATGNSRNGYRERKLVTCVAPSPSGSRSSGPAASSPTT